MTMKALTKLMTKQQPKLPRATDRELIKAKRVVEKATLNEGRKVMKEEKEEEVEGMKELSGNTRRRSRSRKKINYNNRPSLLIW